MPIAGSLVDWFETQARVLPWRTEPRDAYKTLVSEIMLQQTQVDRVSPKFVEFTKRFPDLEALAAATEADVLSVWSGLGYYRRARMLHRLACDLVDSGRFSLPENTEALRALPGIGDYTAAAVGSLAFGLKEPVLDGNVRRVVARVLAFGGDSRSSGAQEMMKSWVRNLFEGHQPGVINEALMELGATVCTPSKPGCGSCPLTQHCLGYRSGFPDRFPEPRKTRATEHLRWVAACLIGADGRWLLRKVQDGPILRDLWLPPFADIVGDTDPVHIAYSLAPENCVLSDGAVFDSVRHHITHRRIEVIPVLVTIDCQADGENALGSQHESSAAMWQWSRPGEVVGGTSSLFAKLCKVIENNG